MCVWETSMDFNLFCMPTLCVSDKKHMHTETQPEKL